MRTLVGSFALLPLLAVAALAQLDTGFQTHYAANLSIGESYINITNTGANGAPLYGPGLFGSNTATGNICVNAYAIDPNEELISCCSCLLTPDQTVNLRVNLDLTSNTLTGSVPTSVTVALVATLAGTGGSASNCQYSAGVGGPVVPGMAAWATTLNPAPAGTYATTETRFTPMSGSAGGAGSNLASLVGRCASIIGNASNHGICASCTAGASEVSVSGTDYLVSNSTAAGSLTTSTIGVPIAGTTIILTGTDEFGHVVNRTTTTNASGQYSFAGLNPSNGSGYTVTETPPASDSHLGQTSTTPGAVTTPASTPVVSNIFLTNAIGTDNFFETSTVSVSGTDYLVSNTTAAASLTTSTTGVPVRGTVITLTGTDAFGNAVNVTTTTNASGQYSFTNLNPSNASGYTVTATPPASDSHLGQTSTTPGAVTTPATTPVVSNIVLTTGTSTDNLFETTTVSVGGTDYMVSNTTAPGSLTTSTTGAPVAGTVITLTGTDAFANAVNVTVTTNASGQYSFAGLNPSNGSGYTVTETPPASDSHLGQTSTTPGAVNTPATTPVVSNIVLSTLGSTDNFFETAPLSGVAFNAGYLYFTDGSEIRKIAPDGTITTVVGLLDPVVHQPIPGFSGDGGPALGAQINGPLSLEFGSARNLYIADTANSCVRKVTARVVGGVPQPIDGSEIITTVVGICTAPGNSNGTGVATAATLNSPRGIAFDPAPGDLYIADQNNNNIRKVSADGTISTVAGTGLGGFLDGLAAIAQFNTPTGVTVDPSTGDVYVADLLNNRVRKIAGGIVSTFAGTGTSSASGNLNEGGAAIAANVRPVNVKFASGILYIVDSGIGLIREVNTITGIITTVAGSGLATYSGSFPQVGDGGPALAALLGSGPNGVQDIALDANNDLFITDASSHRIRFVATGTTTIFGQTVNAGNIATVAGP